MKDYRAFILGSDGRIVHAQVFQAADDESAIEAAQKFAEKDIEIWELGRRVAVVNGTA